MTHTNESSYSHKFVEINKFMFGKEIYINRGYSCVSKGQPDIQGVLFGTPFFFEAKIVNEHTGRTNHPFSKIQVHTLKELCSSGALAIGILLSSNGLHEPRGWGEFNGVKVIHPNDIPEDGIIDSDLYADCEKFDWLRLLWWHTRILKAKQNSWQTLVLESIVPSMPWDLESTAKDSNSTPNGET